MTTELLRLTELLADRYAIERELGRGGMATVYLARDLKHDRHVAVKVLHPDLAAALGADRFLAEIRTTANLQHPHILPLHDSGDAGGYLFYVMPFVEGETLRGRLDRDNVLPIPEAIRIAREVAGALDYAHRRGIVHRDVKPENVLLHDGSALVADFGIALAVQSAGTPRMTQTGLSLGTPSYMSPEQAMGEKNVDARSDIYALGAMLYEMLTGDPPFTGSTVQAVVAKVLTERPTPPTVTRDTVPPAIEQAVLTALAKRPADRFATAAEFSAALHREGVTQASLATGASLPAAPTRTWLPWATLGAGLVVGALFAVMIRGRGRVAESAPPRFWSIALPDGAPFIAAHDPLGQYVRSLDVSPDGDRVAWTTQSDSTTAIWQMRTDVGSASLVPGTNDGSLPTFSPDGRSLAFAARGDLSRIDLGTNAIARIASYVPTFLFGSINAVHWASAERILTWNFNGCLWGVPPAGGTFTRLASRVCSVFSLSTPATGPLLVSTGAIGFLDESSGNIRYVRSAGARDTSASSLVAGEMPTLVGKAMVFLVDSTLYGATIDAGPARLTSAPQPLLTGIRHESGSFGGQLALSRNGTLVWVSGTDASVSRFVMLSPNGSSRRDTLPTPPAIVNSFGLSTDGSRLAYTVSLPGNRSMLHILDLRRGIVDSTMLAVDAQVSDWVDGDSALRVVFPQDRKRGGAMLRGLGSTIRIDTSAQFMSASRDGRMRCLDGLVWPKDAPRDSIRFNSTSNWCRFSPDGKFVSWDEPAGLMIAPVTAAAASLRRRIGPPGANEARWTGDGRELIYRTGARWYVVPSNPPADKPLPTPRVIAEGPYNQAWASWDLAPDGRLLVLEGAPPSRATHLNVMTDFPRFVAEKLAVHTP